MRNTSLWTLKMEGKGHKLKNTDLEAEQTKEVHSDTAISTQKSCFQTSVLHKNKFPLL